ncbi:pyridoxamine 5'-phosphate oxidase family protein [Nocardia sp. NPDC058705]|uniref:pyridoxamine 5'-phosphate oxidase family protein n=1 Tax=Nocardia sp. NPDC058705 TaxID=3346609 RepID=UPI0036809E1F
MVIEATNLDIYGDAELPWSRAAQALDNYVGGPGGPAFLSTVRPDGRPHTAAVGALWLDDGFYFTSGETTRKARNLAVNPACTIAVSLDGIDLVVEATATVVTAAETLERIAARYREAGWSAEVDGAAFTAPYSAPSAGPAPWQLYFATPHTVIGVGTAEPNGATRWRLT